MPHLVKFILASLSAALLFTAFPQAEEGSDPYSNPCTDLTYKGQPYTVCTFDADDDIRLFWGDKTAFGEFTAVDDYLKGQGEQLVFAMNGGMYHRDRSPVGLYRENGNQMRGIQTKAGPGNFGLVPNGVFFIEEGKAQVLETLTYQKAKLKPKFATQSGPMLVIDGELHSKFREKSDSLKRRNGVGVSADGNKVHFVISERLVNFHSFGSLFKDHLKTPNALYLDGTISRLYDPARGRMDVGLAMGPIIGVARLPNALDAPAAGEQSN